MTVEFSLAYLASVAGLCFEVAGASFVRRRRTPAGSAAGGVASREFGGAAGATGRGRGRDVVVAPWCLTAHGGGAVATAAVREPGFEGRKR
jgi:hypothetical protein